MKSNISRATLVRPAALLACAAAMLILVLLTSGQSEARGVKDSAAPGAHTSASARSDKAGSSGSSGGAGLAMAKILPFAVITNSFNLVPGQAYSLIYSDTTLGRSAFAQLDFNGMGATSSTQHAWMACGYNPLATIGQWPVWCPSYPNAGGAAPTRYWLGSKYSLNGPYYDMNLLAGEGDDGWWLGGWDGVYLGDSICPSFAFLLSMGEQDYLLPMTDMEVFQGGPPYFHLRALYTFHIQNSYTVCSPPPWEPKSWYIEGVFLPK